MIHLIKRSLIVQKWQLLIFVPFILVFVLTDLPPILTFVVASTFIPYNALTYDEQAETDILLNSLPYTRKEVITARYLGATFYMTLSIAITSVLLFLFQKPFMISEIIIGAGLFLLFVALTFPIYTLLRNGNITLFILLGFLLLVWLVKPIVSFLMTYFPTLILFITSLSSVLMYVIGSVMVVTFYILSWIISMNIYERKVF